MMMARVADEQHVGRRVHTAMIEADRTRVKLSDGTKATAAIVFAGLLTLAMQGYQFGGSNHTVYLIDALRQVHPELLSNDWFTTQTLQYHAAFGWVTRGLMRAGIVRPAFLLGYIALLMLFHMAWWRIVRALDGDAEMFVISEVLFHLCAGGTALGMYQFLQDAALLPSNIAAVALLWAMGLWLEKRTAWAGACVGVAGLFHLNYALVGLLLWILLNVCSKWRFDRAFWVGTVAAIGPSAFNILLALRAAAHRGGGMPLAEFVALYVRLRHPHHYDPSSWPAWLWISFLWPMPVAIAWWIRLKQSQRPSFPWVEAARFFFIFSLIVVVALIGAGVAYTSEALIQASLYRFSIYPKLLSCIGAAFLIRQAAARQVVVGAAIAIGVALIGLCLWRGTYLGLFRIPQDESSYLRACDWIRGHTPVDAVFLVPPSEQEFRLRAQRAIVVNFKGVPQLSSELPTWRDRMQAVLDIDDLTKLPRPFPATLAAIRQRYDSIPPEHLEAAARRYHARYILVGHRLDSPVWENRRVDVDGIAAWFLYDLAR
jgi:hypothetical protein